MREREENGIPQPGWLALDRRNGILPHGGSPFSASEATTSLRRSLSRPKICVPISVGVTCGDGGDSAARRAASKKKEGDCGEDRVSIFQDFAAELQKVR